MNRNVKCCFCGKEIPFYDSCNPAPVVNDETSRCCKMCNAAIVIPARTGGAIRGRETDAM